MSKYTATVSWHRNNQDFLANKYSRSHEWEFDGGAVIPASSSPHIVPLPWSVEENVDPEEAFIASISSCHMLFFLSIAANLGYQIDSYTDHAVGEMTKNSEDRYFVSKTTLSPNIIFSGDEIPDQSTIKSIHHQAHEQCFIANSIRTEIIIEYLCLSAE